MNVEIFYQDSGIKKDTSKGASGMILALKSVMTSFLKKNPHFLGVKEVSLTMTLCGKQKIRSLNREYRQIDKVTDVLSFPIYDSLRPDKKPKGKNLFQMNLGDLVVCKEKALAQSKEFNITYEQEIVHLVIHGFLHLLGFDHEISPKEEKIMEAFENELVGQVYKKLKNK